MSHKTHDAVGLEIARQIAAGLAVHPEWIEIARSNLDRWSKLNTDAPGLLRCYEEWRELLGRPTAEIARIFLAETDDGQRLRQNSPFAGVLTPAEVNQIKRRVHETNAA